MIGTGDWNDGLDEIGSQGRGESVWLGFFLYTSSTNSSAVNGRRESGPPRSYHAKRWRPLKAVVKTWRGDRYLRAIHDDGTEIGVEGSGIWEIDALTAAWAVMSGINPERGRIVFDTARRVLERDNVILLGWPALRDEARPYLGRSSHYPEGVRQNGMYCHGVQWLICAARLLPSGGRRWRKDKLAQHPRHEPAAVAEDLPDVPYRARQIEIYGGQPNKQAADMLTTFDQGRMIWNGYTGAAGWMLRQGCEGVIGATLINNRVVLPNDLTLPHGDLKIVRLQRELQGDGWKFFSR